MSRFSERLKLLRMERDITQVKLGEYLGYGYTAIANYESRRNEPPIDTLIKIADFFDVTVDYLLGLEEKPVRSFRMTKQEAEVIQAYSKLTDEQRLIILNLMKSMFPKEI